MTEVGKNKKNRQDFHLFTTFYFLFMVFKKRWRAARITFFRLIDKRCITSAKILGIKRQAKWAGNI